MKKFLMLITAMLCILCGAFAFAACGESTNTGNTGNGGGQTEQPGGGGTTPGGGQTEQPGGGGTTPGGGGTTPGGGQTEQPGGGGTTPGGGGTEEVGTEGLQYQKRRDKEGNAYAAVIGLGTAWEADIIIPSFYLDLPVKEISDSAFDASINDRNASLASILIPDSVTTIGDSAFYGCSGLEYVTIPDSVTTIGDRAFCGCSGLESVIFGSGVTSIGERAFQDCSKLTSVTIPDSMTSIEDYVFNRIRDTAKNQKILLKQSLSRA